MASFEPRLAPYPADDGIGHPCRADIRLDVVDADDVGASGDAERSRGKGRLETLLGREVQDAPECRLPARPEQDGPPEHPQRAELAQQLDVVVRRLAEPETRVDD